MERYLFKGTDTSRRMKYKAAADTIVELYSELVNNGTISTSEHDPYDEALLRKNNKTWEDFKDEYDDINCDEFIKWRETEAGDLTDEDILNLIGEEDGNAYYQDIYEWNSDNQEYEEIR